MFPPKRAPHEDTIIDLEFLELITISYRDGSKISPSAGSRQGIKYFVNVTQTTKVTQIENGDKEEVLVGDRKKGSLNRRERKMVGGRKCLR